jgi:hypothetical protein
VAALLREVPRRLDLHDADPSVVSEGSRLDRLWHLIEAQHDVGWVTAGKLLARKRPRLVPVYDRVVMDAVGRPRKFWLSLREALTGC